MALTRGQKAGWGLADAGINIFVVVKQLLILAFLNKVMGVPIFTAGLLTTSVLLFDMITDPAVGYLSDRTRSRWGRRAPWIAAGALVLGGALMALFTVTPGDNSAGAIAWVMGFFILATIGFTMVAIPYGAMAGEMTQDPRERSAMTGWRMAFASIGLLMGGALIPAVAASQGHGQAMLIFGPILVAVIWASLIFTRNAPRIESPTQANFSQMMRLVLQNRAFVRLVLLYGLMTLGIAVITASVPFVADYLITDPGDHPVSQSATGLPMESLMFAAFVLGAILSQAPWVLFSGAMGKVPALALGLTLYIGVLIWVYLSLPTGNLWLVVALFMTVGLTNGAYQQIPWAIYPDLMDVTRRDTGEAVEGAFSALWLFGQKAANALGPLIFSATLALAGWERGEPDTIVPQSETALEALRWGGALVPAGILALSVLLVLIWYRPAQRRALA